MFRLGKFDKSLKYLDEAISLDSLNAIAYIFKGKCYTELEMWEESMRYLNYGLSLDSISLGYHERGYVNNQMGKIEEAFLTITLL